MIATYILETFALLFERSDTDLHFLIITIVTVNECYIQSTHPAMKSYQRIKSTKVRVELHDCYSILSTNPQI